MDKFFSNKKADENDTNDAQMTLAEECEATAEIVSEERDYLNCWEKALDILKATENLTSSLFKLMELSDSHTDRYLNIMKAANESNTTAEIVLQSVRAGLTDAQSAEKKLAKILDNINDALSLTNSVLSKAQLYPR